MCVWSIEADFIGFEDENILDLVYVNDTVQRFLSAKNSIGIAACKGMGKTYLLKVKRMQMQRQNPEYLILPKDNLVDSAATIRLGPMHQKILSSYNNWIDLWITCISIYILSTTKMRAKISEEELSDLPQVVVELLDKNNNGIFHVLHRILNYKDKAILNRFLETSSLLSDMTKNIHQQVALFVDKIDEPFNGYFYTIHGDSVSAKGRFNASIWAYAQLAFVEAVYKFYSARKHINIFYGIRQEAMYGMEHISTESSKLNSRLIKLTYTYQDLYKMFNIYISKEKDDNLLYPDLKFKNSQMAFVGFEKLTHRTKIEESVWAYMYRHTLQRPRDIMEMCLNIHDYIIMNVDNKDEVNLANRIRDFRHWVNECSTKACRSYINSLDPFLEHSANIKFAQSIIDLCRYLPTNIFNKESMEHYCQLANTDISLCEKTCVDCNKIHYFSTLYNIGLLGYIYKSTSEDGYKNKINHIGDSIFSYNVQSLPDAVLFYVHPGLSNIIKHERAISMDFYNPSFLVVNSSEVFVDENQVNTLRDRIISSLGKLNENYVFLSSTERDIPDLRVQIIDLLEHRGYKVFAFEKPGFPELRRPVNEISNLKGLTHDHCIDVMLSCNHVIYILTKKFGGKYHGLRYRHYIDEVKRIIVDLPNISFTEYLVAMKTEKNVKVYVDYDIDVARGEYLNNKDYKDYAPNTVDNVTVFNQLGYFNSLCNGTWYDKFKSHEGLLNYIDTHFPPISE